MSPSTDPPELAELTIAQVLRDAMDRHAAAGRTALVAGGHPVSYAQMAALVGQFAGGFRAWGLKRGDAVGLSVPRSAEAVAAFMAAMQAGACPCFVDPRLPLERQLRDLAGAGVDRLLIHRHARLPAVTSGVDIRGFSALRGHGSYDDPDIAPADPAMMQFTSGSTGAPKAALLSHGGLLCNALGVARHTDVTPEDRFLHIMPLHHTNGINNQIIVPFLAGATVILIERFRAEEAAALIGRYAPTIITGVPTIYSRILPHLESRSGLSSLRFLRCGSAPISASLHEEVEAAFGVPLVVSYGLSEATCTSTMNPPAARRIGSVGTVLAHQDVALLEPTSDRKVAPGAEGEVCIGGPSLMIGYVNAPDERPIVNGWLRTGDLGRFDADGYLSITGRIKDVIIRGGENLSPRVIEEALLADPGVQACCVVGTRDKDLGETPAAFVVRAPKSSSTCESLGQLVEAQLSRAHVPTQVHFVDVLPENGVGKIDREALRQTLREPQEAARPRVPRPLSM